MKILHKRLCIILMILIALIPSTSIGAYADDGSQNSGSGYIPDDTVRLTDDFGQTAETTTPAEKTPADLSDEQKIQIENMMKEAELYISENSVGNPVAPPYDIAYTKELSDTSMLIVDEGNELLYNNGDKSLLNSINSHYAQMVNLLENPIINQQFAAYTCYLSFKDNNYNNWYNETDWQQFVECRNALYNTLTNIKEDYRNIKDVSLTYLQKKEITTAFFNLLELYNKMTLENALLGDVNGDGQVSIADATEIQKYLTESTEFTEGQKLRASTCVNACNDGPKVEITSVTELQKYIAQYDSRNFDAFQIYNIPPQEVWATHSRYPDPTVLNQWKYRNVNIWNPIICITKWSDNRLEEIESQ